MSWEKEYEHLRDRGKTWGPGVDDEKPYTEKELARMQARQMSFEEKMKAYSVKPRNEFVKAGEEFKKLNLTGSEYSKKKIELCKAACESLGFSFELNGYKNYIDIAGKDDTFSISVEYFGWLPDCGGNIHRYFVAGIKDVETCLQLVADFSAVGAIPTTYYGDYFHYSTRNTGELRNELIMRFEIGHPKCSSLDDTLKAATERSEKTNNAVLDTMRIEKERDV